MRRIVVTGANKGIGRAIVSAILESHEDTFVWLGARDEGRGNAARAGLVEEHPTWADRVEVLNIDVSSDASVEAAAAAVRDPLAGEALYGVVNNAGIGLSSASLREVMEVNTRGVHRVCEAFVPLLDSDGGRVVNVTSAAGPNFVNKCSSERQQFFLDDSHSWSELDAFIDECIALPDDDAFAAAGLGSRNAYGLSKACANTYTLMLARNHPKLHVNACTPGFIATDLTRGYAESQGKSPAELGMKPPAEGARAPMHLLFGDLEGNGRYYGSDAERSPLDRYRSPGDPPYTGD